MKWQTFAHQLRAERQAPSLRPVLPSDVPLSPSAYPPCALLGHHARVSHQQGQLLPNPNAESDRCFLCLMVRFPVRTTATSGSDWELLVANNVERACHMGHVCLLTAVPKLSCL